MLLQDVPHVFWTFLRCAGHSSGAPDVPQVLRMFLSCSIRSSLCQDIHHALGHSSFRVLQSGVMLGLCSPVWCVRRSVFSWSLEHVLLHDVS